MVWFGVLLLSTTDSLKFILKSPEKGLLKFLHISTSAMNNLQLRRSSATLTAIQDTIGMSTETDAIEGSHHHDLVVSTIAFATFCPTRTLPSTQGAFT